MTRATYLGLVLSLMVTTSVFAQGTITDGAASFVLGASQFDTTPSADFTGVEAGGDVVFESGWFYRIDGDAQEFPFPAPDAENYTGNQSTLDWNDVDTRGFSAQINDTVLDDGGPSGRVQRTLTITNIGTADLQINIFNFLDIDAAGSFGTDSGALTNPAPNALITVTDGGATFEYEGLGVSNYEAGAFAGDRLTLNDVGVTDFTDSGLPFAPGDIVAGYQWISTISASASETYVINFSSNTSVPVELQSFTIE